MHINTKQTLRVLYYLVWIIFIGVCVEAGGWMFSAFYTLNINAVNAHHSWPGVDLSGLYDSGRGYFLFVMAQIALVSVLKAVLFYMIISLLRDERLDITQPFTTNVGRFLFRMAYLSLLIGLFTWSGAEYAEWLKSNGVKLPDLQNLHFCGADVWLFMGVTIYVIAQVFKRGIDIQTENELTV